MLMVAMQQEDHTDREEFVKTDFVSRNLDAQGRPRFDLLYLERTLTDSEREAETVEAIRHFFK